MYIKLCAYSDISSLCTGTLTARTYSMCIFLSIYLMNGRRLYTYVGLQYSATGSDNSCTGLPTVCTQNLKYADNYHLNV